MDLSSKSKVTLWRLLYRERTLTQQRLKHGKIGVVETALHVAVELTPPEKP